MKEVFSREEEQRRHGGVVPLVVVAFNDIMAVLADHHLAGVARRRT